MTTLTELTADVGVITKRPDRVELILLAIQQATLKAHHYDFFNRDLYEQSFAFATSNALQALDYKSLIPRYRALKYLRKMDSTTGDGMEDVLEILSDPRQILDAYGIIKTNIIYQSGSYLQIRTNVPWQYFIIGCYLDPIVAEVGYSSWIANEYKNAIIYEAARIVFRSIGKMDEARTMDDLVTEARAELIGSQLQVVGY